MKPPPPTKFEEPELSETELRIWIAEHCGFKYWQSGGHVVWLLKEKPTNPLFREVARSAGELQQAAIDAMPKYTTSLNAMREAHRTLTQQQAWDYDWQLSLQANEQSDVPSEGWTWGCSALQHAKAFYNITKHEPTNEH